MIPTAEVEAMVEDGDDSVSKDIEVGMVRDGREAGVASQLLGRGRIMAKAMARRITAKSIMRRSIMVTRATM